MMCGGNNNNGAGVSGPQRPRIVPAFTVQANLQKNTVTVGPRRIPKTPAGNGGGLRSEFAVNYGRPEFPVTAVHREGPKSPPFKWLLPVDQVDYATYVPLFVSGLCDRPIRLAACATAALWDMLKRDYDDIGDHLVSALPRTVFALRRALDMGPRDWSAVVRALHTLRLLVLAGKDNRVSEALVPYYRQLLPPINRYLRFPYDVTATDGIDNNRYNVREVINETVALLERTGGPSAFVNIKYIIPTHERSYKYSCHLFPDEHNKDAPNPGTPSSSVRNISNVARHWTSIRTTS